MVTRVGNLYSVSIYLKPETYNRLDIERGGASMGACIRALVEEYVNILDEDMIKAGVQEKIT